jgi:AraC-like DNA-binding protein
VTTASREAPHHRNLTCVKTYRCKRPECLARDRDYMRDRHRLTAYGRWHPYIDAEPVRAHVRMLMSYGIGIQRVRILADVANGTMTKLLYGDRTRDLGPSKRVRTRTADKILAVRPSLDIVADCAQIDPTGTRRRLQALVATGWPQSELAARANLSKLAVNEQVNAKVATTYGSTARTVRDLYEQLWNVDPTTRGVTQRWINEARALAKNNNWAPPGAWDDDYIDSPATTPDLGDHVDRYTAIAEDARWLMSEQGYTISQAAHRLGITKDHLFRAFRERPETELAA